MTAVCYSGLISAVPTTAQRLGEKRTCVKFLVDISKTKKLIRIYAEGQTGMVKATQLVTLINYTIPVYSISEGTVG